MISLFYNTVVLGEDYFDRLDRERLTKRLVKRLEKLGHQVSIQPAA